LNSFGLDQNKKQQITSQDVIIEYTRRIQQAVNKMNQEMLIEK